MARWLMKRLGEEYGHKTVLEFTKEFGRGEAMRKFGVKDSLSFHNYLVKLTDDERFGYFPTDIRSLLSDSEIARQQYVEAVLLRLDNSKALARLRQERKLLDARIKHLEEKYVWLSRVGIDLVLNRV